MEAGEKRKQLGTGGEEGLPSPSLCPQAAPPCRGDGLMGAAGWTPGCWTPAVPALSPVPARSCPILPASCPFLPAWTFGGADPSALRLPGWVTPEQDQPLALLGCQPGNSLPHKNSLKMEQKCQSGAWPAAGSPLPPSYHSAFASPQPGPDPAQIPDWKRCHSFVSPPKDPHPQWCW